MRSDVLKRFGWAIYLLVFSLAIIALVLASYVFKEGTFNSLLINLASEFLVVALLFFLIEQFFRWNPENELQKRITEQQGQVSQLLQSFQQTLDATKESITKITVYPNRKAIYDTGSAALKNEGWEKLRIFAPVGLWQEDGFKKVWLKTIVEQAGSGNLKTVWGIWGLPPLNRNGQRRRKEAVESDLKRVEDSLKTFDTLKNVTFHFYPPSEASVGFGALIFERSANEGYIALALSNQFHEEMVDCGFSTNDRQVYFMAKSWFDEQLFLKTTSSFILHDAELSFSQRWGGIVNTWYKDL